MTERQDLVSLFSSLSFQNKETHRRGQQFSAQHWEQLFLHHIRRSLTIKIYRASSIRSLMLRNMLDWQHVTAQLPYTQPPLQSVMVAPVVAVHSAYVLPYFNAFASKIYSKIPIFFTTYPSTQTLQRFS